MSGWIKWEKDLETDPRFVRLVRQLRNACYASVMQGSNQPVSTALPPALANTLTIGCLTKFWSYADTHIRADDTLDLGADDIDDLVGVPGFAAAMPEDWLRVIDHQHVELPGYQEHNGVAAKKAALAQKRMDRKRTRDRHANATRQRNGCVTSASLDQTKPDQSRQEESTAAEPPARAEVPRGTKPAEPTMSVDQAFGSLLEDWRRDVPQCNPEAFARWIVHCESRNKPLGPAQRLYQARQLASNGGFGAQQEVVDYCIGKPYYSLIPLVDVRARTKGMTRTGGRRAEPTREEQSSDDARRMQELKDSRVSRGIPHFRDPYPVESPSAYETALRLAVTHGTPQPVNDRKPVGEAIAKLAAGRRVNA